MSQNTHLLQDITPDQYATAVQRLSVWAKSDVGASKVCAQVLLSAYNGYEFHLDITDLCLLDPDLYSSALVVIRGRVELRMEPHETLENGGKVFDNLWKQWACLHVSKRGKQ